MTEENEFTNLHDFLHQSMIEDFKTIDQKAFLGELYEYNHEEVSIDVNKLSTQFIEKRDELIKKITQNWETNHISFTDFYAMKLINSSTRKYHEFYKRRHSRRKIVSFIRTKAFIGYLFLNNCSIAQIQSETLNSISIDKIQEFIHQLRQNIRDLIFEYICPDPHLNPPHTCIVEIEKNINETVIILEKLTREIREEYHKNLKSYHLYYYNLNFDRTRILPYKIYPNSKKKSFKITRNLFKEQSLPIEQVSNKPFEPYNC